MGKTVVVGKNAFLRKHLSELLAARTRDEIVEDICQDASRIVLLPDHDIRLFLDVVDIARKHEIRFLLVTTADSYGLTQREFLTEETGSQFGSVTAPCHAPGLANLYREHLALAALAEDRLPVTIVRLFNSYGPDHDLTSGGGVVATFISALLTGQPVPLIGTGIQTRTFCFVTDVAEALFQALTKQAAIGEIINVGHPQPVRVVDLATRIHELVGKGGALPCKLVAVKDLGHGYEEAQRRVPDLAKARAILRWEPKVSLDGGLQQTIAWQRREMGLGP